MTLAHCLPPPAPQAYRCCVSVGGFNLVAHTAVMRLAAHAGDGKLVGGGSLVPVLRCMACMRDFALGSLQGEPMLDTVLHWAASLAGQWGWG